MRPRGNVGTETDVDLAVRDLKLWVGRILAGLFTIQLVIAGLPNPRLARVLAPAFCSTRSTGILPTLPSTLAFLFRITR